VRPPGGSGKRSLRRHENPEDPHERAHSQRESAALRALRVRVTSEEPVLLVPPPPARSNLPILAVLCAGVFGFMVGRGTADVPADSAVAVPSQCAGRVTPEGPGPAPRAVRGALATLSDAHSVDVLELEVPFAEDPVADVPVGDVPVGDVPVADVPVADVPVADVPVADVPVADVPVTDVPVTDIPAHGARFADAPLATATELSDRPDAEDVRSTPTVSATSLPRVSRDWTVSLMTLSSRATADTFAEEVRAAGLPVEVVAVGALWRVCSGTFATEAEARAHARLSEARLALNSVWITRRSETPAQMVGGS